MSSQGRGFAGIAAFLCLVGSAAGISSGGCGGAVAPGAELFAAYDAGDTDDEGGHDRDEPHPTSDSAIDGVTIAPEAGLPDVGADALSLDDAPVQADGSPSDATFDVDAPFVDADATFDVDAQLIDATGSDASGANESAPPPGPCEDGVRNGDETDTDCGGATCSPCPVGSQCLNFADCENANCERGICTRDCADGLPNGDETDVDCGGNLCNTKCPLYAACTGDSDCVDGWCLSGRCAARCTDDIKNGDEADVDCGGQMCLPCSDGRHCRDRFDCQSLQCVDSICAPGPCSDGVQDGDEEGLDCGGQLCRPCR